MIASFTIKLIELLEVKLLEQCVISLQADQVVEITGISKRILERQYRCAVLNLTDLTREFLCILDIKAEQYILNSLYLLRDLFGLFEKVGVMLHFIAKL